ncbi:MAG: AMP-binding protein [Proteobacteria bacterium]|nr:AMP-binding protein [Pseudomonadota bacterium]
MNETPRPEIAALGSSTLCEAFQITAAQRPGQVALRTLGGATEITYAGFLAQVRALAEGLHSLGVGRGDTVALMLTNRPEFSLADTAVMHLGATAFSVYNTSSAEQAQHVFRNAGNRVVVTERQFLPRVLESRTPEIEHIVLVDGADTGTISLQDLARRRVPGFDFDRAWRAVQPDDVVTLIYTSGTTGPSKAVQLTHGSVLFQTRGVAAILGLQADGRSISYLPSAHVGDRCLTHYGASLCFGNSVTSITDHRQVGLALVEVRPTVFGGVPRVWEKLKAGLEAAGITDPAKLPEQAKSAVRAKTGLDQTGWRITAAAPISTEVMQYFAALGLELNEGWGMSESSCFGTLNPPDQIRQGTVGKPLPGVEIVIAEDGEMLVRAPLVMKGYRGDPAKTAEAIDADGWLHTGDIAQIDGDGYVSIVDRKKELIINSAGKNMSPANIELKLRASSRLIAHAVCIGDRRPYNVALIALDREMCAGRAPDELRSAIETAVAAANAELSRVEHVKRIAIVDADWLPGGDELTPTMKLKRKPIQQKYASEIEELYR